MKYSVVVLCSLLALSVVHCFSIQKIIRPKSSCEMFEIIPHGSLGINLDIIIIDGPPLLLTYGFQGAEPEAKNITIEQNFKKTIEAKQAGQFEATLVNKTSSYTTFTVSVYVDKVHEETDDAEMLKKVMDNLRGDLMKIHNDSLKLKNLNVQSFLRAKTTKTVLWCTTLFPLLYVMLSYIRMNVIKGFFSNKSAKI
ncbi:hypothetical protein NEDG_01673 [Nematocida displodere]|uniref:GOLD domain-containing protein n=1 Tax=Nematocida displodere TaxID=1805483 RepID=A0A177EIN3_9MICR|nr:hypothetical protein NEDG_01673 [Nematocida displodere]